MRVDHVEAPAHLTRRVTGSPASPRRVTGFSTVPVSVVVEPATAAADVEVGTRTRTVGLVAAAWELSPA